MENNFLRKIISAIIFFSVIFNFLGLCAFSMENILKEIEKGCEKGIFKYLVKEKIFRQWNFLVRRGKN
jgi:hypothetical protein